MAQEPFSTLADFKKHWSNLPADEEDDAVQKLEEASIEVRGNYPDIDARITSGTVAVETVRLVVNRMVKRAMDLSAPAGVESSTAQMGPFANTMSFTNPDGNIYLSKADRRLLRPTGKKKAFTIHPGGVGSGITS